MGESKLSTGQDDVWVMFSHCLSIHAYIGASYAYSTTGSIR